MRIPVDDATRNSRNYNAKVMPSAMPVEARRAACLARNTRSKVAKRPHPQALFARSALHIVAPIAHLPRTPRRRAPGCFRSVSVGFAIRAFTPLFAGCVHAFPVRLAFSANAWARRRGRAFAGVSIVPGKFRHQGPPRGRQDHGAGPADPVQFCSRGGASLQMKRMLAEVRSVSDTPGRPTMSDAYTWRLAVEL
jgi:hypothetical protein